MCMTFSESWKHHYPSFGVSPVFTECLPLEMGNPSLGADRGKTLDSWWSGFCPDQPAALDRLQALATPLALTCVSLKMESSISQTLYLDIGSHIHESPVQSRGWHWLHLIAPCFIQCSDKFTPQFCNLLWVLLLSHVLAQLTLCPKLSPTWGLSTHSSHLFRPQNEGLPRLRRKMAFGKTQYPHIHHLKVREAVPQCQGPQLVLCLRSLPLRSHGDNQRDVACQLASAMQWHTLGLCVPREMRMAPTKSNQLSPGVEIGTCQVFYKLSCLYKISCDSGDTEDSVWRSIFSLALPCFHSCGNALTFAAGSALP